MENKTSLRTKLKNIRKTLDITTASIIITDKIKKHFVFSAAKNVMLYYPMKYELNLLGLLKEDKKFYFPKTDGEDLLVCPLCDNFEKSSLNIYEPCSTPVNANILDLIIVPALAVDKENFRLGMGGGFYDRFIARYPHIPTLTPICKEFVLEKFERNKFDMPVDYVVVNS